MIMDLSLKEPHCPICGGKISWHLPTKIEGEYICSTCQNKIDMETDKATQLTMQGFKEYLTFYDQNQLLRGQFVISELIDFGLWNTKIIFDYQNKMFCMSQNPDKTIFEGKQLRSFAIEEDSTPLFVGSAEGIRHYTSTVPGCARALAPYIIHFLMKRHQARAIEKLGDDKENRGIQMQCFDVSEPFRAFHVELYFDHPYWTVIKIDMDGPRFSNDSPDVNDYIRSYQNSIEKFERLIVALKTVAFPGVPDKSISLDKAEYRRNIRTLNPLSTP